MNNVTLEGYLISPQQRRLWKLQQADNPGRYQTQCAAYIKGDVRTAKLKAAIMEVISRNEILRTRTRRLPSMTLPVQVINSRDDVKVAIEEHDLTERPATQQDDLQQIIQRQWQQQSAEPGEQITPILVRLALGERVLIMKLPAMFADGESMRSLIRQIACSYDGKVEAEEAEQSLQYADFAQWQNDLLESEETEIGRKYWKERDFRVAEQPRLPMEEESAAEAGEAEERITMAGQQREAVRRMAESGGAGEAAVLQAYWHILLWRLTGQPAILVGTAFDGRKFDQLKEALGLFERYLPVETQLDETMTLQDVVRQVARVRQEIAKHQEYFSWDQIDAIIDDRHSCFSYSFCFQHETKELLYSVRQLQVQVAYMRSKSEPYKLKLSLESEPNQIVAKFSYDQARFRSEDIRRLAQQYLKLIVNATLAPAESIRQLELLSESDRQLIDNFNSTARKYSFSSIQQMVSRQARQRPDCVAVQYEQQQVSYKAVNNRANQLGRYLRGLGVATEGIVGVCVNRSVEMVIAVLGILKAGGAYLPLDPEYPRERLSYMICDAGVKVVISEQEMNSVWGEGVKVIEIDQQWERISEQSDEEVQQEIAAENSAYVIYTSGSTGRPKGVVITQGAIVNRLLWMEEEGLVTPEDRVLQKTPYSFDASVWEIFEPLIMGGRLVVAQAGGHMDIKYLTEVIVEQEVTVLQMVPTMLDVALEEPRLGECKSLSRVYSGGEELRVETVQRLNNILEAELVNLYGPTEVSIDASYWRCGRKETKGKVPIGSAIANTQVYVAGSLGVEEPIGVRGELYIGGEGLARGYLGRADATAERFVPDWVRGEAGKRLYRSGDEGRYSRTGELQYDGRRDKQVKLRGVRIEIGEIETALREQEGVREAVVGVIDGKGTDKRLVGYVVTDSREQRGEQKIEEELKRRMRERLPEQMIPWAIVKLEEMPLQPNGKVDRGRLLEIDVWRRERELEAEATTIVEEMVAGIMKEALNVERVSREDSFFELGGHSLLAMQVVARVREAFQVDIPLRVIFQAPTVGGLSEKIEEEIRAGRALQTPPISKRERGNRVRASFEQQRLWFLNQLEPDSASYNIPMRFRLRGLLKEEVIEQAINEIIRRHESLRTRFEEETGRPMQVIEEYKWRRIPVVDLSGLEEAGKERQAEQMAREDGLRKFILSEGPPLRVVLIRLTLQDHVILVTVHHIISDASSSAVMSKEIVSLYERYSSGEQSSLPELQIQYADYAHWQREWLNGKTLDRQMQYWRRQLSGAPTVLELPTDKSRPPVQGSRGNSVVFTVAEEIAVKLEELGRKRGATLFMTLLGAFQVVIYYLSRKEDYLIGANIANRNIQEIQGVIGFFLNLLVLRVRLEGDPTFIEILSRTRDAAIGAYMHQEAPFDMIVDEVRPKRDLSRSPLVQVVYNFKHAGKVQAELPHLNVGPVNLRDETTKFDLILDMTRSNESLNGGIIYNTDLFNGSTIDRMIAQYKEVLLAVTDQPTIRLSELGVMLAQTDKQHKLKARSEFRQARQRTLNNKKLGNQPGPLLKEGA
jgi:amino acid adenylation domain-containing protein